MGYHYSYGPSYTSYKYLYNSGLNCRNRLQVVFMALRTVSTGIGFTNLPSPILLKWLLKPNNPYGWFMTMHLRWMTEKKEVS